MKLKWKNLRDFYIKYMKNVKKSTKSSKKYQNWLWAAHLQFLKDTIAPRSTTSNISETREISQDTQDDEVYEQNETDNGLVTSYTS